MSFFNLPSEITYVRIQASLKLLKYLVLYEEPFLRTWHIYIPNKNIQYNNANEKMNTRDIVIKG